VTKLLIVDDEPGLRALIAMTLESEDYEILFAGDGEEAIALAELHTPKVVILDVMMPKMNGFDVCRSLKQNPHLKDTTVVLVTARSQPADREAGRLAGADAYLVKPFSPTELMNKMDDILEGRRSA